LKLLNQLVIKKAFNKIIAPWYSIPLIDRWLLGQIIPPMIFAISAFTVISLSVGVMFDLIRKIVEFGLPLFLALKVLFFSLPSFLVLSFPMAVLLSTLLAYGNISSNSELLALKSLGIKKGDLVCIYMPMIPEAMFAMLACARIGAPHSVVFGGFSSEALKDRLIDGNARFVITADGGFR